MKSSFLVKIVIIALLSRGETLTQKIHEHDHIGLLDQLGLSYILPRHRAGQDRHEVGVKVSDSVLLQPKEALKGFDQLALGGYRNEYEC